MLNDLPCRKVALFGIACANFEMHHNIKNKSEIGQEPIISISIYMYMIMY